MRLQKKDMGTMSFFIYEVKCFRLFKVFISEYTR